MYSSTMIAPLGSVDLALEQIGVRAEPDRKHRELGGVFALLGHHGHRVVGIVAEFDHLLAERQRHAVLAERVLDLIGDDLVEIVRQHAVEAVDQRRRNADLRELFGEFGADIAGADHHRGLGVFRRGLDDHRVVPVLAQQHMLGIDARNRWDHRRRTRGDDQLVEGQLVRGAIFGVEAAVGQGLAGDVDIGHIGAHVHRGSGRRQRLG